MATKKTSLIDYNKSTTIAGSSGTSGDEECPVELILASLDDIQRLRLACGKLDDASRVAMFHEK